MKNVLRLNHQERKIIMDRTFAKHAENTASPEYAQLQQVRRDYPDYAVGLRHIKKGPKRERYPGLTYEYMEDYIASHGTDDEIQKNLHDYGELKLISKCHTVGARYHVIKDWFLRKYPEVARYGVGGAQTAMEENKPKSAEGVAENTAGNHINEMEEAA